MSPKSSFAVIVPCYNEERAIPAFLQEVMVFSETFRNRFSKDLISFVFVDNNSSDQSHQLLTEFAQNSNQDGLAIFVTQCSNQGYGAALKAGFSLIDSNWYGFADLDNTYPLLGFIQMMELAQLESLDIVFANRLQQQNGMPLVRRLGNLFYSVLSNLLFQNSVKDMCTGMRIFTDAKKAIITQLPSDDLKFSIEFTATVLKQGWAHGQIPIAYRERIGPSKLSVVKDGFLFLYILLKVKFRS